MDQAAGRQMSSCDFHALKIIRTGKKRKQIIALLFYQKAFPAAWHWLFSCQTLPPTSSPGCSCVLGWPPMFLHMPELQRKDRIPGLTCTSRCLQSRVVMMKFEYPETVTAAFHCDFIGVHIVLKSATQNSHCLLSPTKQRADSETFIHGPRGQVRPSVCLTCTQRDICDG